MARRYELSDFIKQIGHQGLVFFTFSTADLHWPEFHKLMNNEENSKEERDEHNLANQRLQNLNNNLHLAAWFFNKRFATFFHEVIIPQWQLEDWWFRYE